MVMSLWPCFLAHPVYFIVIGPHRIEAAYCYRIACSVGSGCLSVSVSVCVLGSPVSCAKTDEPIKMLFVKQSRVGPRKHANLRHLLNAMNLYERRR